MGRAREEAEREEPAVSDSALRDYLRADYDHAGGLSQPDDGMVAEPFGGSGNAGAAGDTTGMGDRMNEIVAYIITGIAIADLIRMIAVWYKNDPEKKGKGGELIVICLALAVAGSCVIQIVLEKAQYEGAKTSGEIGYRDGYNEGYSAVREEFYASKDKREYDLETARNEGWQMGYRAGRDEAREFASADFKAGYEVGWEDGVETGWDTGYQDGYDEGFNDGGKW